MSYGTTLDDNGWNVSHRASEAWKEGRKPMMQARAALVKLLKISPEIAEHLLRLTNGGEWHHVGQDAKRVEFFDPKAAAALYHGDLEGAGFNRMFKKAPYACSSGDLTLALDDPWMIQRSKSDTQHYRHILALRWAHEQGWIEVESGTVARWVESRGK